MCQVQNSERGVAKRHIRRGSVAARFLLSCTLASILPTAAAQVLLDASETTLRLRSAITLPSAGVTLADVLDFSTAEAHFVEAIGPKSAFSANATGSQSTVTHDAILARLAELGVNLARVNVGGAAACRITRALPVQGERAVPVDNADELRDESRDAPLLRSVDAENTLEGALRARIATDLASLGGTPEVEFETSAREFLELKSPPLQFGIVGRRDATLGYREYHVSLRRDGKLLQQIRVGAHVRLTQKVLVAIGPINVGTYIKRDSLRTIERVFDDAEQVGLTNVEEVIGQQAKRFLDAGAMLTRADLKPMDMVKSSRPVTVLRDGQIALRLSGTARDSGRFGDTVRVWVGDVKQRREVRGVVTGVGTVTLSEDVQ